MTETRFRYLLVASIALLIAAAVSGLVSFGYSTDLAAAYAGEPEPWLLSGGWPATLLLVIFISAIAISYVGLFLLKQWGRSLALYSTISGFVLYPLSGPTLFSPLEAMLSEASTMTWGVVLALAYFSPISERMSNSSKPNPLRMSTPQLERRPATEADIPFLLALRRKTMDEHLAASGASCSEAQHRERLMHHFDCAEVLCSKGNPVGLLKVQRTLHEWEIIQVQLSPEIQGQGAGRWLLEQVIAEASAARATLRLSVLKANPARHLYERLGFKVVGEDAHEYCMQLQRAG